jgi:hypothetical protein
MSTIAALPDHLQEDEGGSPSQNNGRGPEERNEALALQSETQAPSARFVVPRWAFGIPGVIAAVGTYAMTGNLVFTLIVAPAGWLATESVYQLQTL